MQAAVMTEGLRLSVAPSSAASPVARLPDRVAVITAGITATGTMMIVTIAATATTATTTIGIEI
jgi:hypothetical protein